MRLVSYCLLATALICVASTSSAQVVAPQALRSCTAPSGAITVRTVAELERELARTTAQDISIAPGDYRPARALTVYAPHRVWGNHANNVRIYAGFLLTGAGKPGFQVRCLTLNASVPNTVDQRSGTAIVAPSRSWTNVTIADSRLIGNLKISRAIFSQISTGMIVERTEISGFDFDGIRIKGAGPAILRDLVIQDIQLPGTGTRGGKGEYGIALLSSGATVERVRIRGAYWAGILTDDAHDAKIRDLDVDTSGVGVYVEHYTHRMLLEDFRIGPGVGRGVNFEWDDPVRYGGAPTSVGATIQDGLNEAYRVGVAVMDGQKDTTVQRVTFRNQCGAAIVGHRPRSTGEVFVNNDYSGIDPGAYEITPKHTNSFSCR